MFTITNEELADAVGYASRPCSDHLRSSRLHQVQATQALSSHIVIDLTAILSVPSRTLSKSESGFLCFFAGDSEVALGTCPACSGRHRPHTYAEGCNKSTTSIAAEPKPSKDSSPVEGASLDRVLVDPLLVDEEVHIGASSSSALGPPGLEPQSGAGLDTMPRERPATTIQSPDVPVLQKDNSIAMRKLLNRLRNSTELLNFHLKHYHMFPAQFRHRT